MSLKVIEHNKERALFLAEKLPKVTVLQGDALHRDLIGEANISQTENGNHRNQ
jgi:phospholipid N-methyltransferase